MLIPLCLLFTLDTQSKAVMPAKLELKRGHYTIDARDAREDGANARLFLVFYWGRGLRLHLVGTTSTHNWKFEKQDQTQGVCKKKPSSLFLTSARTHLFSLLLRVRPPLPLRRECERTLILR